MSVTVYCGDLQVRTLYSTVRYDTMQGFFFGLTKQTLITILPNVIFSPALLDFRLCVFFFVQSCLHLFRFVTFHFTSARKQCPTEIQSAVLETIIDELKT